MGVMLRSIESSSISYTWIYVLLLPLSLPESSPPVLSRLDAGVPPEIAFSSIWSEQAFVKMIVKSSEILIKFWWGPRATYMNSFIA